MNVLIDGKYRWKSLREEGLTCWYAGSERAVQALAAFLWESPGTDAERLKETLQGIVGHYALVAEDRDRIVAVVDRVRSYPVFYLQGEKGVTISNSARGLKRISPNLEVDDLSCLEFRMAGYVTGRDTLYRGLYQLQAGEFLIGRKAEETLERHRYFLFYPERLRDPRTDDLIQELDTITDGIFRRVLEEAGGAPIWVPLSGGLDSRLVLCKLKQLGYDNLHAFSYGPPHNHEAKWAREVAKKVGVPWGFFPYRTRKVRNFFQSPLRRKYWDFSGELCSLPFMTDEVAINTLMQKGLVREGCVFVNGQSGDFISGGHAQGYHQPILPGDSGPYRFDSVTSAILRKHYALDHRLSGKEHQERIAGKIRTLVGPSSDVLLTAQQVVQYYEWWEWQERQSKFVVNGQRSYDFFGMDWALPLWADEYLFFWREIPYVLRHRQALYKRYLDRMDFYGVFRRFKPVVWNWQGLSLAAVPVGSLLRRLLGAEASAAFYHYASYFGKYHGHYAPFGFLRWLRNAGQIKSPLVFYVETLFHEEGWVRDKGCANS
ncbi:MAG: asparagine synthase-related protein [Thermodesulfobacteriota bacterium]